MVALKKDAVFPMLLMVVKQAHTRAFENMPKFQAAEMLRQAIAAARAGMH
jgi:hypothetical protein